jgi:RNA polymerase sigma-70 factor (ECF subfamily)
VQGASDPGQTDVERRREVVAAFFKASRDGDFQALLSVLDPDVSLRLDETALRMGTRNGWITGGLRGAEAVATQFKGTAQGAQLALLDGEPGAVWIGGGRPVVAFVFRVGDGRVVDIELVADAGRLGEMTIEILP